MLHSFFSDWNNVAASVWAAVFNSLPAVCILTGCVWLLLERVKGWSAATRYAGWCGMLAIVIALLAMQFLLPHRAVAVGINTAQIGKSVTEASDLVTNSVQAEQEKLTVCGGILLLWVLAMAVQLGRLGVALRHQLMLKRSSCEPDEEMNARWRELLGRNRDIRRPVRLAISSHITMPAVVGYRRPVVLLPSSLAGRLAGEQLDGILLHELAHTRRWDDWAIAMQRLLQAVFALHPLVYLIASKMELQREIACDDWVLRTQQARVYASSLTAVAECCLRPAHSGLMGLAMERPSQLGERVELLLDTTRSVATRVSGRWLGSFISVLGVACFVSLQLPAVMALPAQAAATPTTPVPVIAPVPPIRMNEGQNAVASKELAREQAELSAKQQELGRKQAELTRQQMQLAHTQMAQAQAQIQRQIKEQLEPQMRELREQMSHMHLNETVDSAMQALRAGEFALNPAYLQAFDAFPTDGLAEKHRRLSEEERSKIRAEQERYRAQLKELRAQQAEAAKEFSDRINAIVNEAPGRGPATPPRK